MCKHGTDVVLSVTVSAENSHTGEAYVRPFAIDACIAPIVKALNDAGITTSQSCCGHEKGNGRIDLADGRVLVVQQQQRQQQASHELTCPDCGSAWAHHLLLSRR